MWQKMSVLESESTDDTVGSQPPASSGGSWAQGCQQGGNLLWLQAALTGGEARPRLKAAEDVQAKGQDTGGHPLRGWHAQTLGSDSRSHRGQRAK